MLYYCTRFLATLANKSAQFLSIHSVTPQYVRREGAVGGRAQWESGCMGVSGRASGGESEGGPPRADSGAREVGHGGSLQRRWADLLQLRFVLSCCCVDDPTHNPQPSPFKKLELDIYPRF